MGFGQSFNKIILNLRIVNISTEPSVSLADGYLYAREPKNENAPA